MRVVGLLVCLACFAASGSASAAECTRGMLWPHVRSPGDCLTAAEIQAGQKGAYAGPVNTNVDVSAIKPLPTGQAAAGSEGSGGLLDDLFGGNATSEGPNGPCTKGLLWPFVRSTGDCPTTLEKRRSRVAQARAAATAEPAARVASPPAAPAPSPISAQAAVPAAPAASAPACSNPVPVGLDLACAQEKSSAKCEKRGIWPFRSYEGDCAADAEQK